MTKKRQPRLGGEDGKTGGARIKISTRPFVMGKIRQIAEANGKSNAAIISEILEAALKGELVNADTLKPLFTEQAA